MKDEHTHPPLELGGSCRQCQLKDSIIASLAEKMEIQTEAAKKIAEIAVSGQSRGARALAIAIDLGERLRLRLTDDTKAWPGDRAVLLDLDKLKSEYYAKDHKTT